MPVQFTVEDHTFKWVVDKEATATGKCSKHEECSLCGYRKASVEIPVVTSSNTGKPDGDKTGSGKGSVKTGDNAPTGLLADVYKRQVFHFPFSQDQWQVLERYRGSAS